MCTVQRRRSLDSPVLCRNLDSIHKVDVQIISVYMMRHSRKILNVKSWQHIPNKFIQERYKLLDIYDILPQRNLNWAGHLNRLEDRRLPKQIQYSYLRERSRKNGRPILTHGDIIKINIRVLHFPTDNW